MTPEQRAKAYAESKKVTDWVNGSPLEEAWLDGHKSTADSYISDATIKGMQEQIIDYKELIDALHTELKYWWSTKSELPEGPK